MLESVEYCPRLLARLAEMKALFQLPVASKDVILPLIAAAPWPNAKHIERTWEKLTEAAAGRRYALDLDESYTASSSPRPAATEFRSLFDPTTGYANYFGQISDLPNAIPVLRLVQERSLFQQQLEHIERLDRGLFLRMAYGCPSYSFTNIDWLLETDLEFVLFVDAGWQRDLLLREAWTHGVVQRIRSAAERVEVVVCGSSFPESFSDNDVRKEIDLLERRLFSNVTRSFNEVRITYGDWGSTRPRQPPTPMSFVPRIDLPMQNSWVSFRQNEEEVYADIARRVLADRAWSRQPEIWGIKAIEWTADELPGAIRTPAANTATRVNIHLHRQAQYDAQVVVNDTDEPFTDE